MLVAAGQFAVTSVWEKNAEICASLMAQAAENDVSLFVLPEALLARDDHDADLSVKSAQLLEGEFLGRLRRESKRNMMTTILTIHVPSTPGRAWNMLVARKSLTEMADLLNLQSAAETHLAQYEDFIRSMKPRFVKRGARPLLLTTLIDPRHMLVFGPNSLFQEILDEYGIPNAWQGETNFWGSTAVSIDRLAAYKDVDVLCFDHDNSKDMDALMATPLWQAMPFVRTGRFQRVPAVWFYGATLSAMHFVRVLDNAIGGKA